MAKRTFLTKAELSQAGREFQINQMTLSGIEGSEVPSVGRDFSLWLSERLLFKFQSLEGWEESQPIALGSWARDELCPSSDIDLLFVGDVKAAEKVILQAQDLNFRIRHRVPEDPSDWTTGVDAFDVLALLGAKAFHWEAGEKLAEQQRMIESQGESYKKDTLNVIVAERQQRNERYDSISNFLEPNIKYGAGGLRDLQQALHMNDLFPERFHDAHQALSVFDEYKYFFLAIRQKMHLLGGAEVLSADLQHEISDWLHFENSLEFMKALQSGLSKVSFYADWMLARAKESKAKIRKVEEAKLKSLSEVMSSLVDEPSVLMEGRVRGVIDSVFKKGVTKRQVGRNLSKYLKISNSEPSLDSFFRSRVLELCLPQLARVQGHSQHDHYHRFTLDEHIRQAVRNLKRVYSKPKLLGSLQPIAATMTENDWRILLWTCIYHDLGKGLGGDHSTKGARIVKREFVQMGLSLRLTVEVAWLVKHHLVLSTAAFRMNPNSPKTWKRLHEAGVKGKRLMRLALFTAIDIQSTNPEAWTEWKEQLIGQLVSSFTQPKAERFRRLLAMADSKKVKVSQKFLDALDPMVFEGVPSATLLKDYEDLSSAKGDLPTLIVKNKAGQTWIRFHRKKDEAGLFLSFVRLLSAMGCQVRQSGISTYETFGVYDWFQVKTNKTPQQLQKMLKALEDQIKPGKPSIARFHSVQVTGEEEEGVVVSLRGKDQKGLLLAAAEAFHTLGLQMAWARVHTWGQQIDDVFAVKTQMTPEELSEKLESLLLDENQQFLVGEEDSKEEIFQ
ncbi:MAG: HD domain-containing protein [Bdellovibrionales bacterium]|nr:HD domain-containing protein [Bdellovibrionales bacterium]